MTRAHRRSGAFGVALVVTASLAMFASEARGQAARDPAGAEALFKLGREALDRGRVDEACSRFEESQRLDPGAGTLLNLGACEERRGHIAAAWEAFSGAAATLSARDPRMVRARERIESLARRLAHLAIVPPPDAPAARIFRDQIELTSASLGVSLPVDPGLHRVRVVAPGHADREIEVTLTEGESARFAAELGALVAPTATPSGDAPRAGRALPSAAEDAEAPIGPPRTHASSAVSPASTVALVTAGVLAVAGLTFGGLTYEAGQRVDAHCDARGACSTAGFDAVDDARRWGTFSTVAFVSGGLALTAGLVIHLLRPRPSAAP
jgi:hypothetical protein